MDVRLVLCLPEVPGNPGGGGGSGSVFAGALSQAASYAFGVAADAFAITEGQRARTGMAILLAGSKLRPHFWGLHPFNFLPDPEAMIALSYGNSLGSGQWVGPGVEYYYE